MAVSKIALVTDSTANLPPHIQQELDIHVVPLSIIWDGKTYQDGVDLTPEMFYPMLIKAASMPTTSQVSTACLTCMFQSLFNQGYQSIFVLLMSARLSGTISAAHHAALAFPDRKIIIMDSKSTALALAFQAMLIAKAIKNGADLPQLQALAEKASQNQAIYFSVDDLTYLHRGGRINSAQRYLGTLLDLKPILQIKDGLIEAIERVRSEKKGS